jgi:hypothetical protein
MAAAAANFWSKKGRVFLDYGMGEWHERLLLDQVQGSLWIVCSPDFELFAEQLEASNPDLEGIRMQTIPGQVPLGIDAADVYGFRAMSAAEVDQLVVEGEALAIAERIALGVPPVAVGGGLPIVPVNAAVVPVPAAVAPGAGAIVPAGGAAALAPPVLAPALPRIAGAAGTWVLDEPTADWDVGDEIVIPAGAMIMGSRALVIIGTDPVVVKHLAPGTNILTYARARRDFLCDDPRIVPPSDEVRPFISTIIDMAGPRKVSPPTPLQGPDTKNWFFDTLVKSGLGSMIARHHRWRSESDVGKHDNCRRLVHEHEIISRVIELAVTVDGINPKQLECFEFLLRRMQLMEESVAENPANPSFEGAEFFMGTGERRGGALVAPALRAHVAAELSREAAILKEKRKARESRFGKGGGRGAGAADGGAGG